MILYHGSNIGITEINLALSKPNKDFGKAFYLSANRNQALEMANYKTSLFGGDAVVSKFEFDENISDLQVLNFFSYSKEWAEFVFLNRDKNNKTPHGYDIVYGPIANDRVGLQIINYKEGIISFDEFLERLKFFRGITFQYAFCTQESLKKLKKI